MTTADLESRGRETGDKHARVVAIVLRDVMEQRLHSREV